MQGSGIWLRKLAGLIVVFLWMPLGTVWAAENLLVPEKLDHEAGLYYTVKKGDTLWDISQRFSDSPWLWHDLWRMNPHITNPHVIEPGTRVRILFDKGAQDMPLPPPPPLPKIPHPPKPEIVYYPSIDKAGFISPPITPLGEIFMVRDHKGMVSTDDMIYISPAGETQPFALGQQYLIYDLIGPVVNKELKVKYGFHHLPTGVAEIVRFDQDYAIAKIVQSYRTVRKGQYLTQVIKHPNRIKVQITSPRLEGRIIKAEDRDILFGEDTVVHIDKGAEDGLRAGHSYSIYQKESHRKNDKSKLAMLAAPKADIYVIKTFARGKLVVLFTNATTATALITASDRDIKPGDFFGALN